MIAHFLKRDFKDVCVFFCLFIFFISASIFFIEEIDKLWMMLYITALGGYLFTQKFAGSQIRSQILMSRSYYLALPIKRKKLFHILIQRTMVYYIPFLLSLIFSLGTAKNSQPEFFILYVLEAISCTFWITLAGIHMCLGPNYFDMHTKAFRRIFMVLLWVIRFGVEAGVVIAVLAIGVNELIWSLVALFIALALGIIRYQQAKNLWCHGS